MENTDELSNSYEEKDMDVLDETSSEYLDYLESAIKDNQLEFEVVFGCLTEGSKDLTKVEFMRCIKKLTESDKYINSGEECTLDIRCQQVFRGKKVLTNIRTSVLGILNVKRYCMTESLDGLDVKMIKKTGYKDSKGKILGSLLNRPYNIRFNLKRETDIHHFSNDEALLIKKRWKMMNKYFRYKKRYSFLSKNGLFRIDLTCVKHNKTHPKSKSPIYTKTFREAEVLKSPEKYELEIEYIGSDVNHELATFTPQNTSFEDFIAGTDESTNFYNTLSPFGSTVGGLSLVPYEDFGEAINDSITEPEYNLNSPKYTDDLTIDTLPSLVNINSKFFTTMGVQDVVIDEKRRYSPVEQRSNYKPERFSETYAGGTLQTDDYYRIIVVPEIVKDDHKISSFWVPIGYTETVTHHYIETPFVSAVDRFNRNATLKLAEELDSVLQEILKFVGNTSFLMPGYEMLEILGRYVRTVDDGQYFKRGYRLIGPQPVTLSLNEMNVNNPHSILQGYVVTEKADGIRAQLLVSKEDEVAYIVTAKKEVINTGNIFEGVSSDWIFDGEYITKDKNRKDIKLFMIFDVYRGDHEGKKDISSLPWISPKRDSKSRSVALHEFFKRHPHKTDGPDIVRIESKTYIEGGKLQKKKGSTEYTKPYTTLKTCKRILEKSDEAVGGGYEYETDGLIFLPMYLPVKGKEIGEKVNSYNGTWNYNYKWKPPEENTIDFRVSFDTDKRFYTYDKKNEDGTIQKIQYRKVQLTVGYKERDDELIDFNMKLVNRERPNTKRYMYFNRGKDNSHITNVPLKNGKIICSRDNLEITHGCIVEMKYNGMNNDGFNWSPLRVRTDKDSPQWFKIADNIWNTIINPVSESMIMGDEEIRQENVIEQTKYYVESNDSDNAVPIRDLHNYIKKMMIDGVVGSSGKNISILDTSCGRGGDNQKYLRVHKKKKNIKFILGLDISDNIQEAANRYYHESLKQTIPGAIFLQFDTSKSIKNRDGCMNDRCGEMMSILFGASKSYDKKYESLYKQYNSSCKGGFEVVSSQFSFHYYFRDEETLRGYLQNLKDQVKPGGHFMGTCYDGMRVIKTFEAKESENIQGRDDNDILIYDIIKEYDDNSFDYDKDELSNMFGREISVYMSSIGQYITEYLVNFEFVIDIMKEYGFELASPVKDSIMKKPLGSFEDIVTDIDRMIDTEDKDTRRAYMGAKRVQTESKYRLLSSLNNWFIFQKK